MNIPTPAKVASNRTARLVREAKTPAYSTESKPAVREHLHAVEVEDDYGYRLWSHMPESEVEAFIAAIREGDSLSDVDHSAKCWCQ